MTTENSAYHLDVVILEQPGQDTVQIKRSLEKSGLVTSFRLVESLTKFEYEVSTARPDIILSNYQCDGFTGLDALRFCKTRNIDIPFIFYTSPSGESTAVKCLMEGADHYILKSEPELLPRGIIDSLEKKLARNVYDVVVPELQQSEKLYRELVESASDIIWKTDKHLRIIYLSPSLLSITGYLEAEWTGSPIYELFDNPDAIPNMRWVHKNSVFLRNYSSFTFETIFTRKNGEKIYLEIRGKPLLQSDTFEGLQGIATDITERKTSSLVLDKRLRDLEHITNKTPSAIFRTGSDGNIIFTNNHWSKFTGVSDQEKITGSWLDFVHPEDQEIARVAVTGRLTEMGQTTAEFRFIHSNGRVIWVLCTTIPQYSEGYYAGNTGVLTDITNLKETEENLRTREEQLKNAIDNAPLPVIIHHKGKILQLSSLFTEISGYNISEIHSIEQWNEIATPVEEEYDTTVNRPKTLSNKDVMEGSWRVRTKKYGERIWEFNVNPAGITDSENMFVTSMAVDVTQKKQMEEELFRSRQELNAIFQGAPIMMFLLNVRKEIIKINQTAVTYAKKTRIEILGKQVGNALSCYQADGHKRCGDSDSCKFCPVNVALDEIFEKKKNNLVEELVIRRFLNGEIVTRTYIANVERLFGDSELRVLLTLQDITDRKAAELELKKSEEKFRNLIENAPVGIALISNQGTIRDINNAAVALFRFEHKDFMKNQKIEEFYVSHGERELFLQRLEQGTAFGIETRMRDKYGNLIWLMETAVKQEFPDGEKGYMTILEDITLRKENEAKIKAYQENLEGLIRERTLDLEESNQQLIKLYKAVEYSPVSVVITDADGTIEYANPHFSEITGYAREEAVGQNPRLLKSNDTPPGYYHEMWKVIKSGNVWHGQFKNRKKNGEIFWELCSIAPIFGQKKQISHYVAVKQDITEKMQAEERMKNYTHELEVFNKSMVDRELRMIEMKEEINYMCKKLGIPEKYKTDWKK
jgi:PAS domain S-box-containing protein